MVQHFLLSAKAHTLFLASALRMTDAQAETMFASIRSADTDGRAMSGQVSQQAVTTQATLMTVLMLVLTSDRFALKCRRPRGPTRFI